MSDITNAPTADDIASVFTGGPAAPSPEPAPTPSPQPAPGPPASVAPVPSQFSPTPPVPPVGAAPLPVPGTPTPAPAPAPDPLATTLEGINRTLTELPGQMQRAATPQSPAPQQPTDDTPEYRFQLPSALMQAMTSEDPRVAQQGMEVYAQGLAREVHRTVIAHTMQRIERQVMPAMQQMIQRQAAQAELFRDFYGNHKDLDNDQLRPHVIEVAKRLLTPTTRWNAQFRDQLAGEVRKMFNMQAPGSPAPAPAPALPAPPGIGLQPGTRGGPGYVPRTVVDDIADTLKGI